MNELLAAMRDEINRLRASNNDIDTRLADSLFRIVYDTSMRVASKTLIEKYRSMFPPKPPAPPEETRPFHRDEIRVQRNVTDT